MLFYTVGQVYALPAMLVCGFALGAWYDALRAVRRATRAGAILTAFMDVVFGAGAAAILAYSLFRAVRLEVRLYALICAALGMALYERVVPPAFVKIRQYFCIIFGKIIKYEKIKQILQIFAR